MWQFCIRSEDKLREYGYHDLIIGPDNFDRLLSKALVCKSFKCVMVLMEFYEERLKAQQIPIDLVSLFAKALTIYRAPVSIISKLYKFLRA